MKIWRLLRSAPASANILVAVASVLLLIKILVLNAIPKMFNGAYELGLVAEAVLSSVIASYVFYFIVVHIPRVQDKGSLRPYLQKYIHAVIRDCFSQIKELSKEAGTNLNPNSFTRSELSEAFASINPYSDAPLLVGYNDTKHVNWFQYLLNYKTTTSKSIRRLLAQLLYLDADILATLVAIDDCAHFVVVDVFNQISPTSDSFARAESEFFKYYQLCEQLNQKLSRLGYDRYEL